MRISGSPTRRAKKRLPPTMPRSISDAVNTVPGPAHDEVGQAGQDDAGAEGRALHADHGRHRGRVPGLQGVADEGAAVAGGAVDPLVAVQQLLEVDAGAEDLRVVGGEDDRPDRLVVADRRHCGVELLEHGRPDGVDGGVGELEVEDAVVSEVDGPALRRPRASAARVGLSLIGRGGTRRRRCPTAPSRRPREGGRRSACRCGPGGGRRARSGWGSGWCCGGSRSRT